MTDVAARKTKKAYELKKQKDKEEIENLEQQEDETNNK